MKYSFKKNGDDNISANFKVREFASKCDADTVLVCPELLRLLQAIRTKYGKSVTITSGYRSVAHNKKVGGADSSLHLSGQAADFNVFGLSPAQVRDDIEKKRIPGVDPAKIGLGKYAGFTHIDSRGVKARW